MYSTISVFILMGLPVVATSLSSRQQQSKPIGSPKALLYHMMDRAHNRLSNLVSASTQSFPVQEPSALVWHGWIYIYRVILLLPQMKQPKLSNFQDHGGSRKGCCCKEFSFRVSELMQKPIVVKMWSALPRSLTVCLLLCSVGCVVEANFANDTRSFMKLVS